MDVCNLAEGERAADVGQAIKRILATKRTVTIYAETVVRPMRVGAPCGVVFSLQRRTEKRWDAVNMIRFLQINIQVLFAGEIKADLVLIDEQ